MSTAQERQALGDDVRRNVRDLVMKTVQDPALAQHFRDLALRATAGEADAWRQLSTPSDDLREALARIVITAPLQPFPIPEPSPLDGFELRVRDLVEKASKDPDEAERLRVLATQVATSDDPAPTNALLALFARSPDELAQLQPAFDEKAVSDWTYVTTATTLTTTTSITVTSTLACTFTTTSSTTTSTTTTTTTSHWCT